MRLPPKMTPAQIAEAHRMAREWKRLGAPGKSRSECALDERAASKGRVFWSRPLALLMKLGVALAQPVQSRFDPHHGFDAEADLFSFVRAEPLNQLVGAVETGELESEVLQVMCDITDPLTSLPPPASLPSAAALWLAARRTAIVIH